MSGSSIKIDTSAIPSDKLDRPDFQQLHASIEQALKDPKWRHSFSIHETGHVIYLTRAGLTDFLYFGPRITYDPQKDEFDGFPASVQPQIGNIDPQNFALDTWFFGIAQGFVAGGVFARELTAAPDAGDVQDRKNFEAICDLIQAKSPSITIDREGLWKLAQETVKQDLRSHTFKKEAWEKAGELRLKLFGQK